MNGLMPVALPRFPWVMEPRSPQLPPLNGVPVAIVRGLDRFVTGGDGPGAAALRRPEEDDLFR